MLKEEDNRKLNVFENDGLRTIIGVSCMNHIKMDYIRNEVRIPNINQTLPRRKN